MNQNIKDSTEIDLVEIILILIKNKWKIFSTVFLSLICMVIYIFLQSPIQPIYEAKTEIRPISTFDEFDYEIYNNYLKNTGTKTVKYPIKIDDENVVINEIIWDIDNSSFKKIDKKYLINLFMEKVNENAFISKVIGESGLIKKENFKSNAEFETAVLELVEKIKLSSANSENSDKDNNYALENSWIIKFRTTEKDDWDKFLSVLETSANMEIKKYLENTFRNLILNQKQIKSYRLDDLKLEILNAKDEFTIKRLTSYEENLKNAKDIERMEFTFSTTPILRPDKFYAAKILYDSTEYKNIAEKRSSVTSMIVISLILGLLVGIFYVLISNALLKRK